MMDWTGLIRADFAVPTDRDAAVDELVGMLADQDPAVRDEQAYPVLLNWIRRGVLDGQLAAIGDRMLGRFEHPEVQARTFAPLILAAAVARDSAAVARDSAASDQEDAAGASTVADLLDAGTVRRWRDAFAAWWPGEAEIRGWDDRLGWLHAVAHGADLAGELGASPRLDGPAAADVLTLIAERVVAATDYRYAQMEEDRVAVAVAQILARPGLTVADATGWLEPVDRLFATGEPGPLPVPAANTFAVLRAVYVMVDRRALEHRRAVTDAVAARLHEAFPPYLADRE